MAASDWRLGDADRALEGYERVIRDFPDSIWVAESHYHVGLCLRRLERPEEAAERFRYVVETWPGNRWARFSAEQLAELGLEPPAAATSP